jgi:hypothetical protein
MVYEGTIPCIVMKGLGKVAKYPSRHSCFVFMRHRVQISARRPAILIEVRRGFPHSLQASAWIVP